MGAINSDGLEIRDDLGRRITQVTDDIRESAFLFQRLSVLIQRYNAVAIQGTFAHTTTDWGRILGRFSLFTFSFVFTLGIFTSDGI